MKLKSYLQITLVAASLALIPQSYAETNNAAAWLSNHEIAKSSITTKSDSTLRWVDGTLLTMEGRAFNDTVTSYSRLSLRYKGKVTNGVWSNGIDSAGVALRFVTDSPEISVAWENVKEPMSHMAWTGSGGLDLYARENNQWVYRGTAKPNGTQSQTVIQSGAGREKIATEYLMFLPLYSPVNKLQIGVGATANLAKGPNRYANKMPIVFYGTSITQGGCASRTGTCHTGLLRRWLDYPVINLGFSGSGKCEPIMADLLAEIPAAIYVIETVPNMSAEMVADRAVPFITKLRQNKPNTTILMVESPNAKNADRNAEWRRAYDQLTTSGISNLHYLSGDHMYDTRENPTVDGTHPTDLGFYKMALNYEPVLRDLLQQLQAGNVGGL